MTEDVRSKGRGSQRQSGYWEQFDSEWSKNLSLQLWRQHSDEVYAGLLSKWLPHHPVDCILKTDLFDEAHSEGLVPVLQPLAKDVFGMDIANKITELAKIRHKELMMTRADLRQLPFRDGKFDVIVSNSSIDHFRSFEDLELSVRELSRVLRTGGRLILSVDNLSNPFVFIRNAIPYPVLNRLGLVPYYVGATCGQRRLRQVVEHAGLVVREATAIEHSPRVLTVAIARLIHRYGSEGRKKRYLKALMSFERLQHLPTRNLTGHYVALLAEKV